MRVEHGDERPEQERAADVDRERDPRDVVSVAAKCEVEPVAGGGANGACECDCQKGRHA